MDIKLLLVQVISLLYRASQSPDKSFDAREYAKNVIDQAKIPEQGLRSDFSHDSIKGLKDIVIWMINTPSDYNFTIDEMKQRAKLAAQNETSLYEAIYNGINLRLSEEDLIARISQYRNNIKMFISVNELKNTVRKYYNDLNFRPEAIDWRNIARDISNNMDKFDRELRTDSVQRDPSIVDVIDFSQRDQVYDVLDSGQSEISAEGAIVLPWQGVNRLWGDETGTTGSARRGEMAVVGALQHNFKSGFTLNVFKGHALYNKPYMIDDKKIPTLIRLSFETSAKYDVMYLYKNMYENEFNVMVDLKTVAVEEATEYVYTKLQKNGYRVIIAHINPTDFTYQKIIDFCDEYRAKGHEIHQLNMDYLNMINKAGCPAGSTGDDVRYLYRVMRNYSSEHNIFCITPHQLSSDAKKLIRDGAFDFVKQIANKGYYDGCMRLDQEVDIEVYIHIVKINGESYLTIQRGKHRRPGLITPEKDLFTCYKFSPIGDIRDDVEGQDLSRKSPGANSASEGGGAAWFEMEA